MPDITEVCKECKLKKSKILNITYLFFYVSKSG